MCASVSPVIFGGVGGVVLFLRCRNSVTFFAAMKLFFMSCIVW